MIEKQQDCDHVSIQIETEKNEELLNSGKSEGIVVEEV